MEELSILLKGDQTKNVTILRVAILICPKKPVICLSICTETRSFQRESGVLVCS